MIKNLISAGGDNNDTLLALTSPQYLYILKDNKLTMVDSSYLTPTASNFNGASFSPDGNYLAVATSGAPYVLVYKRNGDVYDKLPKITTNISTFTACTSFSPDGNYLVVASNGSFIILKRSGDTFTQISVHSLGTVATNRESNTISFSPDGNYLAVSGDNNMYIYKRSGDTFTQISTKTVKYYGCASFSPDGIYLAIGNGYTPYTAVYKRSGDVYNKLPDLVFPSTGSVADMTFSPDGNYLVIDGSVIMRRNGDTFTYLTSLTTIECFRNEFSGDGNYLAVSINTGNGIIYKRNGDTFTFYNNIGLSSQITSISYFPKSY